MANSERICLSTYISIVFSTWISKDGNSEKH